MRFFALLFVLFLGVTPVLAAEPARSSAPAQPEAGLAANSVTGLPIPRFVSIRSEPVNVRSGPGERYPVLWVLRKRGMPVQVIAEYENWRKIRDWMGTEGWVHQALVTSHRSVVIHPGTAVLRADPDYIARPLARIETGVVARVESCAADWCHVEIDQLDGWISKDSLWGISKEEIIEK